MFDDEGACPRYWMFSGFVKMSAIIVLPHLDKLVSVVLLNSAFNNLMREISGFIYLSSYFYRSPSVCVA